MDERFGRTKYILWNHQEKLRIAFLYQVASYWPTIESFFQACAADAEVDVQIFFVEEMSVEKVQVENSGKFLKEKRIPFQIYSEEKIREFKPHVALYQPPYDVSYRNPSALSLHLKNMGTRILYIPYGIEIADTEDARLNHFFTFVVLNSWRIYTFSEKMREDYFRYCPNRHAVRALGVPRFDAYSKHMDPAEDLMKELAKGRKIIIWKLHFPKLIYEGECRRQVTPYLAEYLEFAERLSQYDGVLFAVMLHPMFFSQTIDKELAEEAGTLLRLLKMQNNVWIDENPDYRNALCHADAIIIDRSALLVEAGLCGVPVMYMKNKDYEEPLTRAVKGLVDSFEQGTSAKDMDHFMKEFLENGLGYVAERIAAVREKVIPFLDGGCGLRILEDVKQGIAEPMEETVRIVFFGASFIFEHYVKKLGILEDDTVCVLGVSDNDRKKWGTVRGGVKVIPPEELKHIVFDLLVITSEQYYMSIKKKLVYELCLSEEKIVRLDEFAEMYLEKNTEFRIGG